MLEFKREELKLGMVIVQKEVYEEGTYIEFYQVTKMDDVIEFRHLVKEACTIYGCYGKERAVAPAVKDYFYSSIVYTLSAFDESILFIWDEKPVRI
jgi:hypothetical protein